MELRDYLRILRRRWILILGAVVAAMALAALVTIRATPQYASSARMFISSSASASDGSDTGSAYQNGLAATQKVTSYASLVTDGELAQRVIDQMNLDLTPAQLADKIQAQVVTDTVLLRVQVTDSDPKMAQRICREVVTQLQGLIADIETPPGKATPLLKGTVVGPATLPTSPISPQPMRNLLLGGILGLLIGLAIAVIRELLDTSVKNAQDVEDLVEAPVLGGIAYDPETPKHPLVTTMGSHAPRAEAFRVLRTNLQFVDIDAGSKIYVVTSSVPGEGKSTTAANVAITMAQAGQRVLLIDGDLRRPQVADMLGLENVVGVTTVLLGKIDVADAIQHHEASGLRVLASGAVPPNPAELLQSRSMDELLTRLRREFDTIIIDSPPLLPVTDAALLAQQTDGAVIVVRHGQTSREQLGSSAQRLTAVDARLLGVVFNRVPNKGSGSGYGYGYGYAPDRTKTAARGPESAADASAAVVAAGYRTYAAAPAVVPAAPVAPIADAPIAAAPVFEAPLPKPRAAEGPRVVDPRPSPAVVPLEPTHVDTAERQFVFPPVVEEPGAAAPPTRVRAVTDEDWPSAPPRPRTPLTPAPAGSDADPLAADFDLESAHVVAADQATPAFEDAITAIRDEPELDHSAEDRGGSGSLLDEFLTDESEIGDGDGETRFDGARPVEDEDRVNSMWRPSRWIGS